ncbi:MAG: hypothetical protein AABN33_24060 [Acidobacteriota bacterium]
MKQQNINKHKQRKHKGWNRLRKPQHDTETTKQYTEQEIQSLSRNHDNVAGIIRPDTGDLHMPSGLAEPGYGQQTNSPPRVLLVIITLALTFIAIITYLVSQMPKKD